MSTLKTDTFSEPEDLTNYYVVLGFIPGLLHAWYIISITPEPTYDELAQRDPERGQVTYYYVSHQQGPQYQPQQQQPDYGTLNNNSAPAPARSHPAPKPAASTAAAPPPQRAEAGSSTDGPPSYQQAVEGDHKVQKN